MDWLLEPEPEPELPLLDLDLEDDDLEWLLLFLEEDPDLRDPLLLFRFPLLSFFDRDLFPDLDSEDPIGGDALDGTGVEDGVGTGDGCEAAKGVSWPG